MKVLVLACGRLKESHWATAEDEYRKRLRHYATVEIKETKDEAALLAALPERRRLVLLDERGEVVSSEELARKVVGAAELHGGGATLVFAIGPAEGWSDAARKLGDRTIAFGRITLAHRLARIVLLEQIYRSFTILRGEPYHK